MEGIRFAWKIFSFSSDTSSSPGDGASNVTATPRRSSSSTTSSRSTRLSRRRIPLHRACSVPVSSSPSAARRSVRPGAYEVIKTEGAPRQHRVLIPEGTLPGAEFTARVGTREVQVQCPATSKPGNFVRVMIPGEPITRQRFLKPATLTCTSTNQHNNPDNTLWAYPVVVGKGGRGKVGTFKIRIPPRVQPGMTFVVNIKRKRYSITCPDEVPRNRKIRVTLVGPQQQPTEPTPLSISESTSKCSTISSGSSSDGELVAAKSGESVELNDSVDLQYDDNLSNGWMRRLCPWQGKFQWVPTPETSTQKETDQFDNKPSVAYCRQLLIQQGKDQRLPTGTLALVPAGQGLVGSTLEGIPQDIESAGAVSPEMIRYVQSKPLEEKMQWFHSICDQLSPSNKGGAEERSIKMVIRREHLLEDSINALMSPSKDQLRQPWKMEFVHEPAVDSGGVTREWFQVVSEQLFDPDTGLWMTDTTNQMCVSINPTSSSNSGDHNLLQFRFAGRLLGRALFDQQIVKGHLARYLYKHILGWPLTMQDLAHQDQVYYQSLQKLMHLNEMEVKSLCLDFTVTEHDVDGQPETIELVLDGAGMNVTSDNLQEYCEALLRYRMMERNKPQLTELLVGFLDVIPEAPLAVFDPIELELILCGLPTIDTEDWRANTRYSGTIPASASTESGTVVVDSEDEDPLIKWFWEIVNEYEHERKARLLQFATGTAGVPSKGFSALRGADGAIKSFTIHVTDSKSSVYPRAHTCFNRIDLPRYESKEELSAKLETALSMSAVGFGMD